MINQKASAIRACALAALLFASAPLQAASIIVQSGRTIATIADAIRIAQPYDTIQVMAGLYAESGLQITQPLTVLGVDRPIIDGDGKGTILKVTGSDVTITGFVFRGVPVKFTSEPAAILLESAINCEIRGNQFTNNFFAIYLAGARYCRILKNEIVGSAADMTNSGNGIHLWQSRDIAISGNQIRGHRDGIYLEFVKHSNISDNESSGNFRYGLHFMYSDSCRYERNRFIRNGSGVAVMYTHSIEMIENTFAESWGGAAYGLLLKDIKNSRVVRNRITGNSIGVFMEGSDRILIENNEIAANGWAIRIMANCTGNEIRGNNFIDNSFQVATNSRITNSEFTGNYWSNYRGYDLDRDGFGDTPFRPVSLYSLIVESDPPTLVLVRSLLVDVLDLAERILPTLTPETLKDSRPRMRPLS